MPYHDEIDRFWATLDECRRKHDDPIELGTPDADGWRPVIDLNTASAIGWLRGPDGGPWECEWCDFENDDVAVPVGTARSIPSAVARMHDLNAALSYLSLCKYDGENCKPFGFPPASPSSETPAAQDPRT